ncbi:unnamed protein product [Cylicocyclus nassatus]|uniref:Uncharacterized protein n=1 Tax=Cylicocyclus nassatus TaxID=53992 RepID=A0AA36M079_CYLNA|nr:unnamed protein product [Cylicocyclus nassatus]
MAKVKPCEVECNPSTSGSRVGYLITMAAKVFGIVSKRFERSPSLPSTEGSLEIGDRGVNLPDMPVYQQSTTRKLAFGSTLDSDASKPQKDFYNNNTLVNLSKLFCGIVLLTAFLLVMSRSFGHLLTEQRNSTSDATSYSFQ